MDQNPYESPREASNAPSKEDEQASFGAWLELAIVVGLIVSIIAASMGGLLP